MSNCYNLKKIIFDDPIFIKNLLTTYIIHLENNGRYSNIMDQLNKYNITYENNILLNKGYKKCKKVLTEQLPKYDLIDSYYYIFKDAYKKNYEYVLILEDDFIFDDNIKNKKYIDDITLFLLNSIDTNFVFALGVLPIMLFPYNFNINYILLGGGTHAMIYSRKFIEYTLNYNKFLIKDWDIYLRFNAMKYTYYKPLCYQLFPETDNSNNWGTVIGINYNTIYQPFIHYFELDKKIDGYKYFYIFSKILTMVLLLIIIYLIITYMYKINFNLKVKVKLKKNFEMI